MDSLSYVRRSANVYTDASFKSANLRSMGYLARFSLVSAIQRHDNAALSI